MTVNWNSRYAAETYSASDRLEWDKKAYRDAATSHDDSSIVSHQKMLALATEARKSSSAMVRFRNSKPTYRQYLGDFNLYKGLEKHHTDRIQELQNPAPAEPTPIVWPTGDPTVPSPGLVRCGVCSRLDFPDNMNAEGKCVNCD